MKEKISRNRLDPNSVLEVFNSIKDAYGKNGKFIIDDENKDVLRALILYFSSQPQFNELSGDFIYPGTTLSLDKGLMLIGNTGSGKSVFLKIFSDMLIPSQYFTMHYCDEIMHDYKSLGHESLNKYYLPMYKYPTYHTLERTQAFDDLGFENKIKYFGNNVDCMMEIIMRKSRLFVDYGTRSHFTSNMLLKEIGQFYDLRTESRLYEMCNILILGGESDSIDRRKAA